MLNLICPRQLALSVAVRRLAPCSVAASPFSFVRTKASATTSGPSPPDSQSSAAPKKLLSSVLEEPLDPPIKYSTSKASKWLAHDTHTNVNSDAHPWNGVVFSFSTALLLIWFCILREENDVDEQMKKSLWERIPGLERQQLDVLLEYNTQTGQPTEDIRKRIAEIDGKPYKPVQ